MGCLSITDAVIYLYGDGGNEGRFFTLGSDSFADDNVIPQAETDTMVQACIERLALSA